MTMPGGHKNSLSGIVVALDIRTGAMEKAAPMKVLRAITDLTIDEAGRCRLRGLRPLLSPIDLRQERLSKSSLG